MTFSLWLRSSSMKKDIFIIAGALIVFITFIVNDSIVEKYKNLSDSIERAHEFYVLHDESRRLQATLVDVYGNEIAEFAMVNKIKAIQPLPYPRLEIRGSALDSFDLYRLATGDADLKSLAHLLAILPKSERQENRLSELTHWIADEEAVAKDRIARGNELDAIREGSGGTQANLDRYEKLLSADYSQVEKDRKDSGADKSKREKDTAYDDPPILVAIDGLRQQVFERTEIELRSATHKHDMWKIYSVLLYLLGWSVGLAGKFTGVELSGGE